MLPGKRLKTIFGDQPRYTRMNFSPSDMPQMIEESTQISRDDLRQIIE